MIEIRIPKEVNKYEAKFIGPFTLRQSVCLLIALPTCVLLYNLLSPYVPMDMVGFVLIIPASIAFLFGWFQPYGMKFEKFLQSVFISSFVAPSKRKYCTENYFADIAKKIQEEDKLAQTKYNKTRRQKTKYRRSSDAIK